MMGARRGVEQDSIGYARWMRPPAARRAADVMVPISNDDMPEAAVEQKKCGKRRIFYLDPRLCR